MTEKDVEKAIKKCPYRHTEMVGKSRNEKYVICKEWICPCLAIINSGKCSMLKELFDK